MDKKINDISCKIAGAAGDGVLSAGMLLAKTCMKGGLDAVATAEYPSLIRGGHNHLDVRVAQHASSHSKYIDLLIALNRDAIEYHHSKLVTNGAIIYDGDEINISTIGEMKHVHLFSIPLKKIADKYGGPIMRNTVAIGSFLGLLDFDIQLFYDILSQRFGKKSPEIIEANKKASKEGYDYAKEHYGWMFGYKLEKRPPKNSIFLTGNEAISIGAIKAGCKFYSAYPMTPASSLLGYMAANEKQFSIVVKHTEDEISAINMAIGASHAGARAMTGTSGGGFALMVEGFGLAAMTETPLVVVEAQRPGPATGMATHTGQGDLRFVLHAAPDEFPRVVVAPGDVDECFYETFNAFNLADKYQIPVIILTDKHLGESYWSTQEFNTSGLKVDRGQTMLDGVAPESYRRYAITESGVSPRVIPGVKNGMYVASSYEHDEKGMEREEEAVRIAMHDKRFRKLAMIEKEIKQPVLDGPADASVTIVGWGSTKGPIKEAMRLLAGAGISVNYLQLLYLSPFPTDTVKKILSRSKIIVDIEGNKTGQLSGLLKQYTGIDTDYRILKYDGRAFTPEDIVHAVKDIAEKKSNKVVSVNSDLVDARHLDQVKMRTFKVIK